MFGWRRLAGLARAEWQEDKTRRSCLCSVRFSPRIAQSLKNIRAYGRTTAASDDWHIVRSIVLERGRTCLRHCGATNR